MPNGGVERQPGLHPEFLKSLGTHLDVVDDNPIFHFRVIGDEFFLVKFF